MERKTVRSRRTSERLLILSNRCEMCDEVFPRGEKAQHETELCPMRVVGIGVELAKVGGASPPYCS